MKFSSDTKLLAKLNKHIMYIHNDTIAYLIFNNF